MPTFHGTDFAIELPADFRDESTYAFAFKARSDFSPSVVVKTERLARPVELSAYVDEQLAKIQQLLPAVAIVSITADPQGELPARTSVYKFYQYWIRTDDRDAVRYLKFFTFLSQDEIAALEKQHTENPGARTAHKALAKAVTDLVHGPDATAEAMRASEILFGGDLAGISETTFNEIVGEVPTKEIEKSKLEGAGLPLVELLVHSGLCPSKGQARKDIEGGGVNVNNVRESNFQRAVKANDLLFGKHLLLRKGKKNYVVVTAT